MRYAIIGAFLAVAAFPTLAEPPFIATDITAGQVQAFLKGAPVGENSDRPMRVIDAGGYRLGVYGAFRLRNAPPSANIHKTHVAEIYYMLKGAGVLVTGGTLREPLNPHPSGIGSWTDVGSAGIDGGVSRRLARGDIVIIPGGTPHMWASQESDLTYLIVRPDPGNEIALK
jgi:mannose-6-phosphate isomerase-like protein (cupin superfamily)